MKRASEAEPIRPNLACSYPDTEKVERNRTGLSSSSVSETDALLLEMTLGGNKELWEMHWLGHKEKMMKGSGDDKTGNDQIILPPATSCSVNSPFPVESDDDRHRNEELEITEAQKLQMEVEKRLTECIEAQRQLQLKIQERSQFLRKHIENQPISGLMG
ncbi:uncharacterized protein [Coffea arabica]|uniref:Uncharacterized protein isoform X2 n=1 Tax=Coffea arabica TaxID=13443 RepID=A0ABM4UH08_COFAR